MADPTIYGPSYSTYVRTSRLALEEKGAAYKLVEVDMFQGVHKAPDHLARHPFGKVPAFEHDGLKLYETSAIVRYVDEALPGPKLQPSDPRQRARMNLAIAVTDAYGYPSMLTGVVMQRLVAPMMGGKADEAVVQAALPTAKTSLTELDRILGADAFLAGASITLADLFLVPIMSYFAATPEGQSLLPGCRNLSRWWGAIKTRPSVVKTEPKLG